MGFAYAAWRVLRTFVALFAFRAHAVHHMNTRVALRTRWRTTCVVALFFHGTFAVCGFACALTAAGMFLLSNILYAVRGAWVS